MIVRLIIRANGNGTARISTDFKRETNDTPRIANLGLAIKQDLDRLSDRRARITVIPDTNNNTERNKEQ